MSQRNPDAVSRASSKGSKSSRKSSKAKDEFPKPAIFKRKDDSLDPVREQGIEEAAIQLMQQKALEEAMRPKKKKEVKVAPGMETRVRLGRVPSPIFPRQPYQGVPIAPEAEKQKKLRRLRTERDRNFCKWQDLQMPRPPPAASFGQPMDVPSPDISVTKVKVLPRKPSFSPTGDGIPDSPDEKELDENKPKSGIYINETEKRPVKDFKDSFDLVFERRARPKRPDLPAEEKKKKRKMEEPLIETVIKEETYTEDEQNAINKLIEEAKLFGDMEGEGEEGYLTKLFRRKVSLISKATSLNSKDLEGFPVYDEEDLAGQPFMTKIIQKFRRDSEAERYKAPPRKVKRGTLESHSFTKVEQPKAKDFYFGIVQGTIDQASDNFSDDSRGVQGICMSVSAYCCSMLLHPDKWTEFTVDEVLESGDKLYSDSIGNLHIHEHGQELEFNELNKYCFFAEKKIQFQVFEPEIIGLIRSQDKKVYNLYKGLKLFYNRHRAGILRTMGTNIVIWKDLHYYFFDAKGRGTDLVPDEEEGKATLANFYDLPSITAVLLDSTNLGNWPYTLSKISVYKIMDKDAPEEEASQINLRGPSTYNILNENKAVIQASYDLADLCFDFTRNKQAIAMAVVCLVYSRITPPCAWHGKTLDKIMVIGNQLYLELVETEQILEMELEKVPAVFTIGPYVVDILIYSNVYADLMFRKSQCIIQKYLEKFFENNTMAVVYIGKFVICIWKQRNMVYMFDPYSRNHEALKCRNGAACVSMNTNLETIVDTICTNFDNKDDIFSIHALKVLKIMRDPAQDKTFPKSMCMDDFQPEQFKEYKMQKTKRKAVNKTVTAEFDEPGVTRLEPWNFLPPSLIDIGSGVGSLLPGQIPPMMQKYPSRAMLRATVPDVEKAIDLDSPSLSDTQIHIERPEPRLGDDAINMDAWELTQEELELQEGGEEGEGEQLEAYMAMHRYAQVHEESLESYRNKMSIQVNTDITVGFLPVPREVLPATNMRWKQNLKRERELARKRDVFGGKALALPEVTQSMELIKPTNFINLPDNTQLIRGTSNIAKYGKEVEYMAPFVCMMAAAVAQKYALLSWATDIVDYTLKSGVKLYEMSRVRYDQVPILEVPKISLGRSDYSILVQYLYDTVMKQQTLELTLDKLLFRNHECGLVVTPSYACAVFLKNHLYYMFDPFGCNQVGLGEGPTNTGRACFARFKNIHDLAKRIMYNKAQRDAHEEYEFTRFVISSCTAKFVPPEEFKAPKKTKSGKSQGEGEGETPGGEPQQENKVGYQFNDGILTLQGSTGLTTRGEASTDNLKEDHFICLCACLMVLTYPILKWDTKRVDYVIDRGRQIYAHAENLQVSKKRIIRNILINKHFFDIVILAVEVPPWKKNNSFSVGFDTAMSKKNFLLVQFPNCCYTVYKHNDYYHLFDPYTCKPNGEAGADGTACWILFEELDQMKARIEKQISGGAKYVFYTFEITSVRKAPKAVVVDQRLREMEMDEPIKPEIIGKPFHEKDYWLRKEPVPWSRMKATSARNEVRGKKDNMWHNWEIEYTKDLYSLTGTLHQNDPQFPENIRGKQTLGNLIVGIGMLEIYRLAEWNAAIMDSIIISGNTYFEECIKDISDEDHELSVDDLKTECTIYPYKFDVVVTPVVEGTMFLMRAEQFNLYKALTYFLGSFTCRYGLICASKGDEIVKRFVAFGKIDEGEYFVYDAQVWGPPMFPQATGVPYILRMRSLKRLVHVLTLTLRGGDFFIFDVDLLNFKGVE